MRRFSIRTLMACVLLSAVGLAALRSASRLWAGIMMMLALAAIGVAILGAALMRGRERAWWLGFAVFGGGYLVLTFAPGLSSEVGARLVTTKALDAANLQLVAASGQAVLPQYLWWQHARALGQVDRLKAANREPGDRELDTAMRILANLETQLQGAADQRDFLRVGHSLFGLFAGLVGGMIAVWFYARCEAGESNLGAVPPPTLETASDADERDR
jgi:hypothetical protein